MKSFVTNLLLTFFTALFTIYLFSGKVDAYGLIVGLISAGIVALGYLFVYLYRR